MSGPLLIPKIKQYEIYYTINYDSSFFISCNNNEITLDKAEIRFFLKKRNPNYSFPKESENNFSRNLKPELEPLYLNNLKELEEFLDKIDAMKSENYSRTSITHVPLENGGNGNNPGRYIIQEHMIALIYS